MIRKIILLFLVMILIQGCSKPNEQGVGMPRPAMDEDEPLPAKEKVNPTK